MRGRGFSSKTAWRWTAVALLLAACGKPLPISSSGSKIIGSTYSETNWNEPAVRIIFHRGNFTDLEDYRTSKHTQYACLGDAHRFYFASGDDFSGSPTAFTTSTAAVDDFTVTTHPAFLKEVSVDMTQTYYSLTQTNIVQTDGCSYRGIGGAPLPSSCADFDQAPSADPAPTVVPTATPSPAPCPTVPPTTTQYYGTGYYRVRDDWCSGQGPILSSDAETTKSFVGGITIDLDRNALAANEDLLMVMTYHALSANYNSATNWPNGTAQSANDQTMLKVSLVGTGLDLSSLLRIRQPRVWSFYRNASYPIYWQDVATFEDPYGSLRSEQVYLPISKSIAIDRIRIDRVRGSYHLFEVDLYRLGNRGP